MSETGKQRRQRLIEALRAPMPEGFTWDFCAVLEPHGCGTAGCAIGLACQLWPGEKLDDASFGQLANFFDLPSMYEAQRIFFSTVYYPERLMRKVTPQMVADKLETFR